MDPKDDHNPLVKVRNDPIAGSLVVFWHLVVLWDQIEAYEVPLFLLLFCLIAVSSCTYCKHCCYDWLYVSYGHCALCLQLCRSKRKESEKQLEEEKWSYGQKKRHFKLQSWIVHWRQLLEEHPVVEIERYEKDIKRYYCVHYALVAEGVHSSMCLLDCLYWYSIKLSINSAESVSVSWREKSRISTLIWRLTV